MALRAPSSGYLMDRQSFATCLAEEQALFRQYA
jgi:hypothetical protein